MTFDSIHRPKLTSGSELSKKLPQNEHGVYDTIITTRMYIIIAIAEKTFNPTITKSILTYLDSANDIVYSLQLHEHLDIPLYNDIKAIIKQEHREAWISQGTNRQSSYNYHHIIPKRGHKSQENGSQIINSCYAKDTNIKNGIITLKQQGKARTDLYTTYPLPTRLCNDGRFFGANLVCNLLGMIQKRHNQGLNARYDGNMLPHHMILAELMYATGVWNTNEILMKIKQDIVVLFEKKLRTKPSKNFTIVNVLSSGQKTDQFSILMTHTAMEIYHRSPGKQKKLFQSRE